MLGLMTCLYSRFDDRTISALVQQLHLHPNTLFARKKRLVSRPITFQARKMAQQVRQCSAFELALHEVCSRIPSGKVSTYGAVAKVLRSSPRAVGRASFLYGLPHGLLYSNACNTRSSHHAGRAALPLQSPIVRLEAERRG